MQEMPFFDEYGFKPSVPFKIPTWFWVVLAFVIGGAFAYFVFKPEEEKKKEVLNPNSINGVA